jgi:hypothetical protein
MTRPRPLLMALFVWLSVAATDAAEERVDFPRAATRPRAQVFVVENREATDAFEPRLAHIQSMVDRAITNMTAKSTVIEAWRSLVSTQDVVGIKVFSEPGPNSGTRQSVVAAVIQGLLSAGVASNHIVIWDKRQTDLRLAGFFNLARRLNVRVAGSIEAGYDENKFYETSLLGNLVWGDFEFGKKGESIGRKSFVSKLVSSELTKIINITPLMNHNQAGVSGSLLSLTLGSVDNTARFASDSARLATAVPEIYALPELSDRVVLNVVDALICQYEGEERSLLHYSTTLNQLRFSRDPVALDVLSLYELDRQRKIANAPPARPRMDLYSNASLLELGISDPKQIDVIKVP